jgi:hypothetical protein
MESVTNKPFMLSVVMLSVVMLSVIMLSVVMLNVIMLSVVILNVLAPCKDKQKNGFTTNKMDSPPVRNRVNKLPIRQRLGDLNKDPTVCIDEARPTQKVLI